MIIPDTNAILTYGIDFDARREGGKPVRVQRHGREAAVALIDGAAGAGTLRIPDMVAAEVRRTAAKAVSSAAKSAGAPYYAEDEVVEEVRGAFHPLYKRFRIEDREEYVGSVNDMYIDIWGDARMADAVGGWLRVKEKRGKRVARPSVEANKGDFVILSTAAYWAARGHTVKLVTFDHDFLAFAGVILERLGVRVVDCRRPAR